MSGDTGIFLQVRLGSTRLPRKALRLLAGKAVIIHAMEALSAVPCAVRALLSDDVSADELKGPAAECGFALFKGPPDDVLLRFILAADEYGVSQIVRATGDNPLVDAGAAEMILALHLEKNADYSGFIGLPLGTGVEILRVDALKQADRSSNDSYDHEHVSPYLYRNPDKFAINRVPAPEGFCLPDSSVTIDTDEDYRYAERLFNDLYRGKPLSVKDIIPWLEKNGRGL